MISVHAPALHGDWTAQPEMPNSVAASAWQSPDEIKVCEYVESVAKSAETTQIVTMGTGSGAKGSAEVQALIPYINAFEGALTEHSKLQETLQNRVELLVTSIGEDAGELHLRIQAMGEAFSTLFSSFKSLETGFEKSHSVATQSGKLIESLCRLKRRSKDAKELFIIFTELVDGRGTAKIDAILESANPEMRAHGAKMMRRLRLLSGAAIEGATEGSERIKALTDKYEDTLLSEFHAAFDQNNLNEMRLAASLLMKYNGGQSCVESFVSQHAFFVEPVVKEMIRTRFTSSCLVDISEAPVVEPLLSDLFEQIAQTAEADWTYLEAVFEDPVFVMNRLVQRIFREPVKVHIEEVLRQARAHSDLAYLRTLFATHQATSDLLQRMRQSYSKHIKETASRQKKSVGSVQDTIGLVEDHLRSLLSELFASHLRLPQYLELEDQTALSLYLAATQPSLENVKSAQPQTSARKVVSKTISSVFGKSTPSSPVSKSPKSSTVEEMQEGGEATAAVVFAAEQPLVVRDEFPPGVPSEGATKRCLALHAELSARLFTMLPAGEGRGQAINQSLNTLLSCLLERFVERCLDSSLSSEGSAGKQIDPLPFLQIRASSRILGMILQYSQTHLLPLVVTASSLAYRDMVEMKTEAAARVTEKIDNLLQKQLYDAIANIREHCLGKQRKSDFKPRPDDLEALVGASQACVATCKYIDQATQVVLQHLDPTNAASFLSELGAELFALLIEHFKGYTVTESGAMVLQNDLKQYSALVERFGPAASLLKERYEMLWELGHLYVVRPENLRSILQEGHLGKLDVKLVYPYISNRGDFNAAHVDQLFPDMEKSFTRLLSL